MTLAELLRSLQQQGTTLDVFFHAQGLPKLVADGFRHTSDETRRYNCIAWAVGDTQRWWWPTMPDYWPPGIQRAIRLPQFIAAYGTRGYAPCADGSFELGLEKVVIYCLQGEPKHAARQLDTGLWTSKLGKFWDVEHATPAGVEGPEYGTATQYMSRPIGDPQRVQLRALYLRLLAAHAP